MRNKFFVLSACCLLCSGVLLRAQEPVPVFPAATFNSQQADEMLNNGTATLRGVVKKKQRNPDNTYLGIVVTLFPCTPYFNEWYELQKKNKKGKSIAMMSPQAYSYRIVTKASDKDGTFEFRNLKPGKYYLQTMVRQGKMKEMWNQVGTATSVGYNVYGQAVTSYSRPIYEDFKLFYETNDLVKDFVEITSEGQTVNVKL
ncbi:hypothetical protein HF324_31205 [Chitinophaga oryzae]|uniref:Carboxypeptidase regulatory-like domain-containing protein n=1 Tax=Chitinophaga oryzae TaxID=2725414 RepID=A0AAE6ZLN8_9BACT|nr:SpaA isopeptide-forming pilin-related protein [Chitinophaga oryzae]QJB35529.1 hypothetical protein HF329_31185 [Chitinophaga oryzae]QJB42072.1 hypothetical protein HF324_31205 [Chitinophaga oryzae]